MLKRLFAKQKEQLDHFFEKIDDQACTQLVESILQSEGVLFFTGVGKSGFIAQKIAATLMSTGTKAFFLPPIDALHGDLGMVCPKDIVIILSKSGETEELLQLLPSLRAKKAAVVAVCSNPNGRLVKGADSSIILPCEHELCPYDLAPTTSTQVQLLFGDALAIGLMEAKEFSLDRYAENHPSGQIGRRASFKVQDLMLCRDRTPTCHADDTLEAVLMEFTNKRCGCLLVLDEKERLLGIFTDGDLRRALQTHGPAVLEAKIADLMTPSPKSIHADEPAFDAVRLMESDQQHPVMVLPVLDRKMRSVVGIIKMHDLIQAGL
ncbi:MAG: Arabinose 5-phosphate isomerase KdsD [Chlamydiales bacterium]|nr:Arabinose 5-phosphate isomerase KdsD [Chlamydiales bacterium]MCH9635606.1 Arabinose 5-phosphate isomerase KdsD [Chlamydiales bacterium]MCH9703872.1 KpsF/GutQ family sugar-phosphate isomerase [Chlamydiota bacterium]